MGTLTTHQIKQFYDAFGKKQDRQFYEKAATDRLIGHSNFAAAQSVVELGCGTGKFARRLLASELPANARYIGIDVSETMISISRDRLCDFAERVELRLSDGRLHFEIKTNSMDRFVSTYVLELLGEDEIRAVLAEAHRILVPGGRLCLAVLAHGVNWYSKLTGQIWKALFRFKPSLVGGCRPISLARHLDSERWRILHQATIVSWCIASEVLVAEKLIATP